jgi:hypothetical protein
VPTPNQRCTKILCLHEALLALTGLLELYASSRREAYVRRYNTKIVGDGLKELYLQFKRHEVDVLSLHFRITLRTDHLRRPLYGLPQLIPGSVFEVSHAFTSVRHLNETIR